MNDPRPPSESVPAPADDIRRRLRRALSGQAAERLVRPQARQSGVPRGEPRTTDFVHIKAQLQTRLLEEIGDNHLLAAGEREIESMVQGFVDRVLDSEELPLNEGERTRLADELIAETVGIGPLAPLMADPAVTDILVNGPESVYVERYGQLERTNIRFQDAEHIIRVIERIASRVGRRIDHASPMVDLRLPDGSRVNATIPPVSVDHPTLSIRRFGVQRLRAADLVRLGMMTEEMAQFLAVVVRGRQSILISGGTGAGKSTLLGALAESIPHGERIITIEDTAELKLDQEHVVRLETRPPNVEGRGRITARDLVINSLRMRPTRIIVGEVRGGEAIDMLQALNTGHEGGMSTIHANSTRDALSRLETMVLMAGMDLPSRAIREQIASAIALIIQVHRFEDGVRRVARISEVTGMEGETLQVQDIIQFERRGLRGRRIDGDFRATGIVPRVVEKLRTQSLPVSLQLFSRDSNAR